MQNLQLPVLELAKRAVRVKRERTSQKMTRRSLSRTKRRRHPWEMRETRSVGGSIVFILHPAASRPDFQINQAKLMRRRPYCRRRTCRRQRPCRSREPGATCKIRAGEPLTPGPEGLPKAAGTRSGLSISYDDVVNFINGVLESHKERLETAFTDDDRGEDPIASGWSDVGYAKHDFEQLRDCLRFEGKLCKEEWDEFICERVEETPPDEASPTNFGLRSILCRPYQSYSRAFGVTSKMRGAPRVVLRHVVNRQ